MNVLKRLPGNGKESGKSRSAKQGANPAKRSATKRPQTITRWRDAPPRRQSTDVAGLYYLLVDCFAHGMSQPLDLVFYHQFPAL
jgi:hypothetical protein